MRISPNYDGTQQYFYNNAKISTLIDGKSINMTRPSGLAIHNDIIYVSDNESSTIFAFDKNGTMIDYLSLGLDAGSIMGIEIDNKGNLWFVNNKSSEIMLVTPK